MFLSLFGSLLNHLYRYGNENVSVRHLSLICITSILITIYSLKNCSVYERSCHIYSPKSFGFFRKELRQVNVGEKLNLLSIIVNIGKSRQYCLNENINDSLFIKWDKHLFPVYGKRRLFSYFSVNPRMPASRQRHLLKLKRKKITLF